MRPRLPLTALLCLAALYTAAVSARVEVEAAHHSSLGRVLAVKVSAKLLPAFNAVVAKADEPLALRWACEMALTTI